MKSKMRILIIDNYDSFTYNIVQLVRSIAGAEPKVLRNDEFQISELSRYDKFILSPGPGIPREAGKLLDVIDHYASSKRILGICLGHQAVGEVFGARLIRMPEVMHGVTSQVRWPCEDYVTQNIPQPITTGHYHSWILSNTDFPDELEVTMTDDEDRIMGIRHKKYDVRGLQFHPESMLTPCGGQIITNWINHKHETDTYQPAQLQIADGSRSL
jgi:anthranilate synthase component 2